MGLNSGRSTGKGFLRIKSERKPLQGLKANRFEGWVSGLKSLRENANKPNQNQARRAGSQTSAQPGSGFPVELAGVGTLHAAFLNESRTRGLWWRPVQEIRRRAGRWNKGCRAPEVRHYLHPRVPRLWHSCNMGIYVPALPGWADVWLSALRAWF